MWSTTTEVRALLLDMQGVPIGTDFVVTPSPSFALDLTGTPSRFLIATSTELVAITSSGTASPGIALTPSSQPRVVWGATRGWVLQDTTLTTIDALGQRMGADTTVQSAVNGFTAVGDDLLTTVGKVSPVPVVARTELVHLTSSEPSLPLMASGSWSNTLEPLDGDVLVSSGGTIMRVTP